MSQLVEKIASDKQFRRLRCKWVSWRSRLWLILESRCWFKIGIEPMIARKLEFTLSVFVCFNTGYDVTVVSLIFDIFDDVEFMNGLEYLSFQLLRLHSACNVEVASTLCYL
jgi:hypothetical protein